MTKSINFVTETPQLEIERKFNALKDHQFVMGNTTVAQRRRKLKALHQAVLKYRPQIKEAMYQDFKKHPSEVDLTEVYPITREIKHTRGHLKEWMANQPKAPE